MFLGCGFELTKDEDKEENEELDRIAKANVSLDAKDYVALAVAALETLFLPLVVLVVVILVVALLVR